MTKIDACKDMPGKRLAALAKAELIARLEALPCAPGFVRDTCPAERLQHELSTHQAELESQNQELRESQQRIEQARDRYSDLYDFAPVGYLTLDPQGCVREINLTGARMLGSDRNSLLGKPLVLWLRPESHSAFHQHLNLVRHSTERVTAELKLRGVGGSLRYVSMVSTSNASDVADVIECRSALVDITELKNKETELTLSRQQLRNLSAHLDRVREDERRHLAREIHDELGQKLTSLRFEVALLGSGMDQPQVELSRKAATLLTQIDDTIEAVRAIASDLRPAVLDLGLVAAIEWQLQEFSRRTGIGCDLKLSDEVITLDNERATAIFRIVQESLTNVIRHAGANRIRLSMSKNKGGDKLLLQVSDNGVGMTTAALKASRAFGIAGMRERTLLMGGEMKISSRAGRGTKLAFSFPLRERRQAGRKGNSIRPEGE
jgi:PAS domain S-box-containing protein